MSYRERIPTSQEKELTVNIELRADQADSHLAQVHRAWLPDGREVAVKVQYPGIAGIIATDLAILQRIVELVGRLFPSIQLQPLRDYSKETLPLELDFLREAKAMAELRAALHHRWDVLIPTAIADLSTERLLVMECIHGVKILDRAALLQAGISPQAVARLLNDVYAEQIFRLGILHADPHPGKLKSLNKSRNARHVGCVNVMRG